MSRVSATLIRVGAALFVTASLLATSFVASHEPTTYLAFAVGFLIIAGEASTLFTIIYGTRAPWWRSKEGWHLFGFTATIALLVDLSLVKHFAGAFAGLQWISLGIYAAIAIFMVQRLWLMLRAQFPNL